MDALFQHNLLSLILFAPLAAALIVLIIPKDQPNVIRWAAFVGSLFPLGLAIYAWLRFDSAAAGFQFQFQENYQWFSVINSYYHLGVDGISLPMVLLTTILTPLALLFSFSITEKVKAFMVLFLMLETGMLGVFMSLDLILFFLFWEVGLIPMYFLINIWGSANRRYASFKFFIYTMAGSVGLLLAIQTIGITLGSFDMVNAIARWPTLAGTIYGIPTEVVRSVAFWAFTLAFAIKVPIWPFHTWLPDAHTEAPTGGSMILAGVLLKLGAYGFLRLVLPLYPVEAAWFSGVLATLGLMAIIFGALASFGQTDFKRLVAYSSVNHMGFVVLGIAAAAYAAQSPYGKLRASGIMAANGAVMQMFSHGLSAAAMFLMVGVIYDRTHTRNLNDFGGIFPLAPVFGGLLIFTSVASLGLPGLAGFVSEFMVVRGTWPIFTAITILAMIGLLMTGAYILKGVRSTLYGPVNRRWIGHRLEISAREVVALTPLIVLLVLNGVWPAWLVRVINDTVTRFLA